MRPWNRIVAVVAGRRTKFVALGVWVVVALALGPLAGRFESVQRNEPSSFLPGDAESVVVLEASERFPSGEATPAIAVFRAPEGLGPSGRDAVERARIRLAEAGLEGVGALPPPVTSEDGRAAVLTIPIEAGGDEEILIGAVEDARELVRADLPPGLEVAITGPAGFSADASKAFEGVNSTLLLATAGLVFVLLVLIYRSPIFWVLPLLAVLFAEAVVRGLGTLLAGAGLVVNGQTGGILLVLVFGAGTDYALRLTARYREELHRVDDKHDAMRVALRQGGPAIAASAGTVVAALLCLSLAQVNSIAGLGPVGAMGVAVAAASMLTLLPALLLLGGRRAFWPFVPRRGTETAWTRGFWGRLGTRIERRHRGAWIGTTAALLVLALGTLGLDDDLTTANAFRGSVESVEGQRLLEQSFPAGAGAPTVVLVTDPSRADAALDAARSAEGVVRVGEPELGEPGARFEVTLAADPFDEEGFAAIEPLRDELRAAVGEVALVGGASAEEADLRAALERDTKLLVPLVLLVVFAILVLLLRSLAAPLLLMATVVLSFVAALGASLLLFGLVADFPGEDPSYPLFAFIFLVALGVDYNIFLMARVREEALSVPHARRDAQGARRHRRRDHVGRDRPRGHVLGARGPAARCAHAGRGHGRARGASRHARRPVRARARGDLRAGRANLVAGCSPEAAARAHRCGREARRGRPGGALPVTGSDLDLLAIGVAFASVAIAAPWVVHVRTGGASHVGVGLARIVPVGLLLLPIRVTGIPATYAQALRSRADHAEYRRRRASSSRCHPAGGVRFRGRGAEAPSHR